MSEPSKPTGKPNRLIHEKSPYLLQHAHNPVDWMPWGEEAFARARAEDKPIFLSIGYSTCHWCHVMERESFESEQTAAQLNQDFVSIKVDREERPDIDRVYMSFVQATTGGGGWPMSVFLTPTLEPFYGGTYFPPDDRYGRPGFGTLLARLSQLWNEKRVEIKQSGAEITERMRAAAAETAPPELLDRTVLFRAFKVFEGAFDPQFAGFGQAPKFPRPVTHRLLMRYFARTGDEAAARMVTETLRRMAEGGMYDHLGGGFHRYSVDRYWHVPHFEKMLYDQAQLIESYVEGFSASGDPFFARIAKETADYVLRDLCDEKTGGFYSAEDADSPIAPGAHERAEGAFYVFTHSEVIEALGAPASAIFSFHYGLQAEGNAEDPHGELRGKNVLHVVHRLEETAQQFGKSMDEIEALLGQGRQALLALRAKRPRPHLDDKILCGWNGLAISALARAGSVLGEPRYLAAAERAATFVLATLCPEGRLARRYRQGEVAGEGYMEDYAYAVKGLLDLYEASLARKWLDAAERLTEQANLLFYDPAQGGFFATSGRDPSVLVRLKDDYDGAEPGSNSIAAENLLRLADLAGRDDWLPMVDKTFELFSVRLRQTPHALPALLCAFDQREGGGIQVVIAGARDDAATGALTQAAQKAFAPGRNLLLADRETREKLGPRLPYIRDMVPGKEGQALAYVCRGRACERPTADPAEIARLLGARTIKP